MAAQTSTHTQKLTGGFRQWTILGIAVIGLTTATTVLAFFLPIILNTLTDSRLLIGLAGSVEGIAALTIPLIIGPASDRTWNRFGRRLPYMLAATPLVFLGLATIALLQNYWLILGAVGAFFVGYYVYYTAYQALYPDLLPDDEYGRAWGYQSLFQGAGVALALLGGGALLSVSLGAPFLVAAVVFVFVAILSMRLITEDQHRNTKSDVPLLRALPYFVKRLRADRNLRFFLAAHLCWEFTLAAIRAFVILYLVRGLGLSVGELLPVLVVTILAYLIAAVVSGQIADRFDPRRYTAGMVILYGASALVLGLVQNQTVLKAILPFGMFAGAAVLMLAYPILLKVTPPDRHGEYTGYYQFNRGIALVLGGLTTGGAIDIFGRYFQGTSGYAVLWLVVGAAALLSLPFYLLLTRRTND